MPNDLIEAINSQRDDLVQSLLAQGIDPLTTYDIDGSKENSSSKYGIDPSLYDECGLHTTPIHHVCRKKNPEILAKILAHIAEYNPDVEWSKDCVGHKPFELSKDTESLALWCQYFPELALELIHANKGNIENVKVVYTSVPEGDRPALASQIQDHRVMQKIGIIDNQLKGSVEEVLAGNSKPSGKGCIIS
ncbi:MAG: hypothetical protein HON23_04295 [Rickettsiales bacterium]|jgi:hypothetical protein|nr:hypothetical protein [Rickettsiales bacterium]